MGRSINMHCKGGMVLVKLHFVYHSLRMENIENAQRQPQATAKKTRPSLSLKQQTIQQQATAPKTTTAPKSPAPTSAAVWLKAESPLAQPYQLPSYNDADWYFLDNLPLTQLTTTTTTTNEPSEEALEELNEDLPTQKILSPLDPKFEDEVVAPTQVVVRSPINPLDYLGYPDSPDHFHTTIRKRYRDTPVQPVTPPQIPAPRYRKIMRVQYESVKQHNAYSLNKPQMEKLCSRLAGGRCNYPITFRTKKGVTTPTAWCKRKVSCSPAHSVNTSDCFYMILLNCGLHIQRLDMDQKVNPKHWPTSSMEGLRQEERNSFDIIRVATASDVIFEEVEAKWAEREEREKQERQLKL